MSTTYLSINLAEKLLKSKKSMEIINSAGNLPCYERGQTALQNAKKQMEQNEDYESIRTLVEFMISFKGMLEDLSTEIIQFLVRYILPPLKYEEDFSDEDYKQRMERLKTYVRAVLGIPKNEGCVAITNEMSESFRKVVRYVGLCIDKLRPIGGDIAFNHDMGHDSYYFIPPESYQQVHLGLNYWPTLHKLIGPSPCAGRLYAYRLTQSIRLISIMFGVNNHWGTLFGSLTKRQIVPNSAFEMFDFSIKVFYSLTWNEEFEGYYPFLFKPECRQYIYRDVTKKIVLGETVRDPFNRTIFKVLRSEIFEIVEKILSTKNVIPYWYFIFKGEKGQGLGPTKEFYSKFSEAIKKYDLNLWIGEPDLSSDGINYVNSPCGLFPSPCLQLDERSKNILRATGRLMAKAVMDNALMDLNFSHALYRYMVEGSNRAQCLNLNDLKDVMPSLVNFVDGLLKVMNEASRIKNDMSLAPEEQQEAISNLKCDGCSFEDLCINFTVPGFSDIEMVEGGSELYLTADNIEKYLQLLVWWLLYKGPQEKLECIRAGYISILDEEYFVSLLPVDMDNMLYGIKAEPWTIEELSNSCLLKRGLTLNTPVVKNLFKLLSSFNYEEQKEYLKFITSSPNLPVGGLKCLKPRLTIDTFKHWENEKYPDDIMPIVSTCYNLLFIPKYTSMKVLRERLLTVLNLVRDRFL